MFGETSAATGMLRDESTKGSGSRDTWNDLHLPHASRGPPGRARILSEVRYF